MAIGTKDVKNALWNQLERLKQMDSKSKEERELLLKESNEILKVTGQITDVLKVELQAMEMLTKQEGVKLGEAAAAHFGVIDKS